MDEEAIRRIAREEATKILQAYFGEFADGLDELAAGHASEPVRAPDTD